MPSAFWLVMSAGLLSRNMGRVSRELPFAGGFSPGVTILTGSEMRGA